MPMNYTKTIFHNTFITYAKNDLISNTKTFSFNLY